MHPIHWGRMIDCPYRRNAALHVEQVWTHGDMVFERRRSGCLIFSLFIQGRPWWRFYKSWMKNIVLAPMVLQEKRWAPWKKSCLTYDSEGVPLGCLVVGWLQLSGNIAGLDLRQASNLNSQLCSPNEIDETTITMTTRFYTVYTKYAYAALCCCLCDVVRYVSDQHWTFAASADPAAVHSRLKTPYAFAFEIFVGHELTSKLKAQLKKNEVESIAQRHAQMIADDKKILNTIVMHAYMHIDIRTWDSKMSLFKHDCSSSLVTFYSEETDWCPSGCLHGFAYVVSSPSRSAGKNKRKRQHLYSRLATWRMLHRNSSRPEIESQVVLLPVASFLFPFSLSWVMGFGILGSVSFCSFNS